MNGKLFPALQHPQAASGSVNAKFGKLVKGGREDGPEDSGRGFLLIFFEAKEFRFARIFLFFRENRLTTLEMRVILFPAN